MGVLRMLRDFFKARLYMLKEGEMCGPKVESKPNNSRNLQVNDLELSNLYASFKAKLTSSLWSVSYLTNVYLSLQFVWFLQKKLNEEELDFLCSEDNASMVSLNHQTSELVLLSTNSKRKAFLSDIFLDSFLNLFSLENHKLSGRILEFYHRIILIGRIPFSSATGHKIFFSFINLNLRLISSASRFFIWGRGIEM